MVGSKILTGRWRYWIRAMTAVLNWWICCDSAGWTRLTACCRPSTTTRHTAGAVANILRYLSDPKNAKRWGWCIRSGGGKIVRMRRINRQLNRAIGMIEKMPRVEDFLHPQAGKDWLLDLEEEGVSFEYPGAAGGFCRGGQALARERCCCRSTNWC